ncbi:MAG: ATP-dependent DNA helicase, partial [Kineosporiaceae bacterium]
VAEALALVRDSARDLLSQLKADPYSTGSDGARQLARASLTEVFEVVDRLLTPAGADLTDGPGGRGGPDGQDGPDGPDRPDALAPPGRPDGGGAVAGGQDPARDARGAGGHGGNGSGGAAGETASAVAERQAAVSDVTWLSRNTRSDGGTRVALHVAPLSVAGLLRERLFATRTVVLTSATLTPGGAFDTTAASLGLPRAGAADTPAGWRGLDVGSPFDYPKQAILYVARHLPSPGRDGLSPAFLDELTDLVRAAGGRTLGLFSSRRAAEQATEELRERLDTPVLCQGEDMTATLVRRFAGDAQTSLFGTLSLWQGVDVPGPACQLVVIDRIPFPRPDDPLTSARQLAVNRSGGNGFMAVAARHAALLLAQGTGRLIRSGTDRGVVAVLDSRLATARYGSYLRASLPPFWTTTDRAVALDALGRIDVGAGPLRPVAEPGARSAASDAGT